MTDTHSQSLDTGIRQVVDAAREVWISRLIDYSRANSLIFYRDLKVGTLDLTSEPNAVERLLAGESLTVDALVADTRRADSRDPIVRTYDEARQKARAALIALQRKALGNLEEKGIETLHLAIGLATWPAGDGGRPYDAPVLLLPARIEMRGRAGDDLRLTVVSEPQVNPVLIHVLETNHGIRMNAEQILDACGSETRGGEWRTDPDCVFNRVTRAASGVPGFEIRRRVILANFQFAKIAMVEDIKKNGDAMAESVVVRAIAGHQESRRQMSEAVIEVEPAMLDERPPKDDFLVLTADSTQQRAIVQVSNGQNCVVQGPPGTGKSQTIANLIAQSVADGRSVLFVAEKRAALEAVIKRLNHPDVGLGHLVLDLHGASVSRKEVMARLADTLEQIRHARPAEGIETVHQRFEVRRRQLNQHAFRVNVPREPTDLSVYGMVGQLLRLPAEATSAVRLRDNVLAQITAERADTIKQWILDGTAHPTLILGIDDSPWNNANISQGIGPQEALDVARDVAIVRWPVFERLLDEVVRQLTVRPPATLAEVETLLGVLHDAREVRANYRLEVFEDNATNLEIALDPAGRGGGAAAWAFVSRSDYRAARRRLLALRTNGGAPAATLLEDARQIADVQKRWRDLESMSETPTEAEYEAELSAAYVELTNRLNALGAITEAGSFRNMPLTAAAARLRNLSADTRTPYLLPSVYDARKKISEAGLDRLLDDFREHAVRADDWIARFEYVWLHSALDEALKSDPTLAGFNGRTHEQLVAEFVVLDRERVRLAAERVRRRHAERAIEAQNQYPGQADLVRREAAKKSRHIPSKRTPFSRIQRTNQHCSLLGRESVVC